MVASDARSLAHLLAQLDDASLTALFTARRVPVNVTWSDAFDAADELLDAASITRALTDLSADQATALEQAALTGAAPGGPARDTLQARALLDEDGAPYASVAAAVGAATRVDPANTADDAPAAPTDDAREAERAFTAAGSLADILHSALATPLSRIGAGTVGASDRRRLIESGTVEDSLAADELIDIAERSGLLIPQQRHWLVTPRGADWLHTPTVARWNEVALALREALPEALRTASGGWIPLSEWQGAYPYDPSWPAKATTLTALAQRWALAGADGASATWAQPVADGDAADTAALQALLPPEVDRVYLQNDLTAISPGPLEPQLDMRLRSMARRESRAQASTYRFTAETLAEALTAGESAASVREFLEGLSLTGLPQPLAYEIERTASRHGALRVGPDWQGRTRVTSDDDSLLRTVAVDQALRPLGLVPDEGGLVSRSGPDTAFWMIADARYPVIAVDADGQRRALDRRRVADSDEAEPASVDVYAPLVARLRAAHSTDADAAWLGRELDQAVRARATIIVVVSLPDGTSREFTIEATGMGGGRLRGRDRLVDVERTLPVSSITAVRPV